MHKVMVLVTERFTVRLGPVDLAAEDARGLARDLVDAANRADVEMEDHIAATRRRGWVPPLAASGEAVL